MRILLNECVNPLLRLAFPGDDVKSVAAMGRRALKNGALMKEPASRFDEFVTLDRSLQFQNQVGRYALGVVVLITRLNDIEAYRPHFADIRDVVKQTKVGQMNVPQIR